MTHSASEALDHLGALVEELGQVSNCVRTLYTPHPSRQAWAECQSGAELASILHAIRHARDAVFDPAARDECAWDMILDLARSELIGATVTVSNLCAATSKPQTSALRKLNNLVEAGLVTKRPDMDDRRRVLVELTERARHSMERLYGQTIGKIATPPKSSRHPTPETLKAN
jgi:DNA-binding HxlR family transcriptional regulator